MRFCAFAIGALLASACGDDSETSGVGGAASSSGDATSGSPSSTTTGSPTSTTTGAGDGGSGPGGAGGSTVDSSTGQGGDGGEAAQGGAGVGGSGGSGGVGGGVPIEEQLKRIYGSASQQVNDVALSLDGETIYFVGTSNDSVIQIDDYLVMRDTQQDDIFAGAVSLDGSQVYWFSIYGSAGDDRGTSIAVGQDDLGNERVFIGGVANGRDNSGQNLDYFAPGLDPAPTEEWGYVVELRSNDGLPLGGVSWGTAQPNDVVDVTVTAAGAFGVGTCRTPCLNDEGTLIGNGDDVIVAALSFSDETWTERVIARPSNQKGVAIAANPEDEGFAILGEMDGTTFDPSLPPQTNEDCEVSAAGSTDAFVAFFRDDGADYACEGARSLGNAGADVARAVVFDGDAAFVAMTVSGAGDLGEPGPYVIKATTTGTDWARRITDLSNSDALTVALDGSSVAVGGRLDDDAFFQRLSPSGALGDLRVFDGGQSDVRGLVIGSGSDGSSGSWVAVGTYQGAVTFGALDVPEADGRDGWVARLAAP